MTVHDHPTGGYRYSRGSRFAAHGVVSQPGFTVDHAVFDTYRHWDQGFAGIRAHLESQDRPLAALAGIELRMPAPLEFEEFKKLNDRYLAQLAAWELLIDGESPFCRTNVAPTRNSLDGPAIAAFSYTVPEPSGRPAGFVLSGAAEVPLGAAFPEGVVRRGETVPDAMVEKASLVADLMDEHLASLDLTWEPDLQVHLYAAHDVAFAVSRTLLAERKVAPNMGIIWHDAAPPTHEIELEIDLRRYRAEHLLASA